MTFKFTIPGKLPGLNEYINAERRNKFMAAKMKKQAEDLITWSLKAGKRVKFKSPVAIHYLWVEKDKRRDKDNICFAKKFIQDALVRTGVLENDGWKQIADFKDDFEVGKPKIEVTITEVQNE